MLSKKDFEEIGKDLRKFESERELTIQTARKVIQLSKQVIYAVHRDDIKNAGKSLEGLRKEQERLPKHAYDTEIYRTAVQEYVEALCYYYFVKESRIPSRRELEVNTESYLLGLCDLTGELVRRAVAEVIKKNYGKVKEIKGLVEEIYGEFLKFDLRNGELRKKSESVKWNLKRLEDIEYQLTVR